MQQSKVSESSISSSDNKPGESIILDRASCDLPTTGDYYINSNNDTNNNCFYCHNKILHKDIEKIKKTKFLDDIENETKMIDMKNKQRKLLFTRQKLSTIEEDIKREIEYQQSQIRQLKVTRSKGFEDGVKRTLKRTVSIHDLRNDATFYKV